VRVDAPTYRPNLSPRYPGEGRDPALTPSRATAGKMTPNLAQNPHPPPPAETTPPLRLAPGLRRCSDGEVDAPACYPHLSPRYPGEGRDPALTPSRATAGKANPHPKTPSSEPPTRAARKTNRRAAFLPAAKTFILGRESSKSAPFPDRLMFAVLRSGLVGLAFVLALLSVPALGQDTRSEPDPQAALAQLLDVLRDDQARAALIAELEAVEEGAAEPRASDAEIGAIGDELRSFGSQVADVTGSVVEGAVDAGRALVVQLLELPAAFAGISASDFAYIGWLVANLAVLVVVTYGGLFVMALLTDRLRQRLRIGIIRDGVLNTIAAVLATLAIDVGRALVPWALGYVVALSVLGEPGELAYHHLLYLNAFLVLELAMAVLRAVLAPLRPEARMVTLPDRAARAVMGWSRLIASVLVYGQLLALPLLSRNVSPAAGRVASVLGLVLVLVLVGLAILRMRGFVATRLVRAIGIAPARRGLRTLARFWHVPVLVYLCVLFLVALSQPVEGFYAVIWTNAQIAIAILAGVLVTNIIARFTRAGIPLPGTLKERVPLLETRLNAFVPRALWVLRALIVVMVAAWCLHLLGAIDLWGFLESEVGGRISGAAVTVLLILFMGFFLWLVLNSWVEYRISPLGPQAVSARERTLLVLLRNALTITLIVIILMFVLSEVGLNIAPLLASAGVIGLAIGFGAQKLVQDIINGVFIQLEGAIDVGDVVQIANITGVVERLTVRSAALRDFEGSYHLVPFSSVDTVTNFMRGFSFAVIDMRIAYRQDVEKAKSAMLDAFEELRGDSLLGPLIMGELEWFGVDQFGPSEVVVRARIRTRPGQQWAVRRAYNTILKRVFAEQGVDIPYPHQTVYFGQGDKVAEGLAAMEEAIQNAAQQGPQEKAKPPARPASPAPAPAPDDDASTRTRDLPFEDDDGPGDDR